MTKNPVTKRPLWLLCLILFLMSFGWGCGEKEAEPKATTSPHASSTPSEEATPEGGGHGAAGDPWSEAIEKATLHAGKGELTEASEYSGIALKLAREKDDSRKLITSLHNAGKLALSQGDTQGGIQFFTEALELEKHAEKPDPRMIALGLNKIAAAHYAEENHQGALESLNAALSTEGIDKALEAELLHNLASIYQQVGNTKKALECQERSRQLRAVTNAELPTSGPSGQWFQRKFSTHSYKRLVQIFQERNLAPSRIAAYSRFNSRLWSPQESEESDNKTSH